MSSRATAPRLDSGWLAFPHLGDCTQDGHPASQSQLEMACLVALEPIPGGLEATFGESGPAVMAVIDEDGEPSGRGVQVGGDAADIPAVAGGEEREQADRGMFHRMGGPAEVDSGGGEPVPLRRGDGPPHGPGPQLAGRQVQRLSRRAGHRCRRAAWRS